MPNPVKCCGRQKPYRMAEIRKECGEIGQLAVDTPQSMQKKGEEMMKKMAMALCVGLLGTCLGAGALAQSKYDGLRDPFERPPKGGTGDSPKMPPRVSGGPDGRTDPPPRKPVPAKPPAPPTEASKVIADYVRWNMAVFSLLQSAWGPALVFVAGETRAEAQGRAANAFIAIASHYLVASGWPGAIAVVTVRGLQLIEVMHETPETGVGSDSVPGAPWSKARWEYLEKVEAQEKKERMQGIEKFSYPELPDNFRGPASTFSPSEVMTEEKRRRAMFVDQSLSKQQAMEVVVRGAGAIYGQKAERFARAYLWLYDRERIVSEGLSPAALGLYYEGDALLNDFHLAKGPNACRISSALTPHIKAWACKLDGWGPSLNCYCPVSSAAGVGVWNGKAGRNGPGFVCTVPGFGACPMVSAAPKGTLCQCTGFGGAIGQIRR